MTVETERTSVSHATPGSSPAPRGLLPSLVAALPVVAFLLLMLLVTQVGAQPPSNGDTWFHLRVGHLFWDRWSLWHPGALTRFGTSDWVPSQWSTEMLSAKLEDWFGLPGVAWMYGVLYLGFLVAVYAAARRIAGPGAAVPATCGALFAASTTLATRPQAVSLVLLPVTVGAWLGTRRDGRARWWLVPLTWLWATAHGFWVLGVIVGLVCWVGLVLDREVSGRDARRLLLVPVLSLVAALVTPVGPRLLLSQLIVGQRVPSIGEWGPTSFRSLPAVVLALMVAVLLVRWLRGDQVGWMPLLLLGLALGWGVLASRLVVMAAILVAPLLAEALGRPAGTAPTRASRGERLTVVAGFLACVAWLAVMVPSSADQAADVPSGLTARLAAMPRSTPVLVEDSAGGWLEWRFPGSQPVLDGLLDAYPVGYIEDFQRFRDAQPGWRRFVARTGARVGVMLRGSAASVALQSDLGWRVVQTDRTWVLLAAPGTEPGR